MSIPGIVGLVLAGGQSSRMGQAKADIRYHGTEQWRYGLSLLERHCDVSLVSVSEFYTPQGLPSEQTVRDAPGASLGPFSGLMQVADRYPSSAIFVLACDLPLFDGAALQFILQQRAAGKAATAFIGHENWPEPLCAIYEPSSFAHIKTSLAEGVRCPTRILRSLDAHLVHPLHPDWILNANDAASLAEVQQKIAGASPAVHVRYVAQLREEANKSHETVTLNEKRVAALYAQLKQTYRFSLDPAHLRVAVNDALVDFDYCLSEGDQVIFLPPMAGG